MDFVKKVDTNLSGLGRETNAVSNFTEKIIFLVGFCLFD